MRAGLRLKGNVQLCCLNLLIGHNKPGNELANQERCDALSTTATPDSIQSVLTDLFPLKKLSIQKYFWGSFSELKFRRGVGIYEVTLGLCIPTPCLDFIFSTLVMIKITHCVGTKSYIF